MSQPPRLTHQINIAHQIVQSTQKRPARRAGFIMAAITVAISLAAVAAYAWVSTRDSHEALRNMGANLAHQIAQQSNPGIIGFDQARQDLRKLGIHVESIVPVAIGGCVARVSTSNSDHDSMTAAAGWLYIADTHGRIAGIEFTARAYESGYIVTHLWKAGPVPDDLQAYARQDFEAAFGESDAVGENGVDHPTFLFLTYGG